jgi:hypothetical protein
MLLNQFISSFVKVPSNGVVHFFKSFEGVTGSSLDDLLRLRNTDFLEGDTGLVLDVADELLLLDGVESDASTRASSSSGSSWSMDVGLSVFWGFDLDNEINTRDVQSTSSNISSYKHTELFVLESLESDFTLVLSDVSVHDFNVLLDLLWHEEGIGFGLGWCEHNGLASAVDNEDVSESSDAVVVGTVNGQVSDCPGCFVLEVWHQVDNL